MAKRLFETLDQMNVADGDNKTQNVTVCNSLVSANYSHRQQGTVVAIGVPGNVAFDLEQGKKIPILLMIDKAEYDRVSKSDNPYPQPIKTENETKD